LIENANDANATAFFHQLLSLLVGHNATTRLVFVWRRRQSPPLGQLPIDLALALDVPAIVVRNLVASLDNLRDGWQPLGLTRQTPHGVANRSNDVSREIRENRHHCGDVDLGIIRIPRAVAA
jgi:hypothetical protein